MPEELRPEELENASRGVDAKVSETDTNYIEAINKLKKETVSKDLFDKLKAENAQLLNTLVENGQYQPQETTVSDDDINKLRADLFRKNSNMSNLEFCDKSLKLRKALMDKGEQDPFVPIGNMTPATDQDYETAERVASVIQDCIDRANGNSALFTTLLNNQIIGR